MKAADRPGTVNVAASWQRGLETLSGFQQWKLRLQLVAPAPANMISRNAGFALIRSTQDANGLRPGLAPVVGCRTAALTTITF